VEGARPRARPKKTWKDIVEKDCQARKLNREDAMDHNSWMKQMTDGHNRCEWVNVSSGTGSRRLSQTKSKRAVKRLCACVCVCLHACVHIRVAVNCVYRVLQNAPIL